MSGTRGLYRRNAFDLQAVENYLDPASPDTMCRRTMSRKDINGSAGVTLPTTGKLCVVKITLEAGDPVTNISFVAGTTAAVSPTSWWVALYTGRGVLLAQSADQVAGAIAASSIKTIALATAQKIKESGDYYLGLCIAAGTMPTVLGTPIVPAIATGEGTVAYETTATYTTTAPATLPALTARVDTPYLLAT